MVKTMMKPLLAGTVQSEDIPKLQYPLMASPKLDGIRAIVMGGSIVSRNLKLIQNTHVQSILGNDLLNGLDGELIVGDPTSPNCFRETSSGIMAVAGEPKFKFHIFDLVPDLADRVTFPMDSRSTFARRYAELCAWDDNYRQAYGNVVEVVPHQIISSPEELLAYEEKTLAQGYEGVMLRTMSGVYKFGRSTLREGILLKLKRFLQEEAEIVSFVERMHNGNEAVYDNLGHIERSSSKAGLVGRGDLGAFIVKDLKTGVEFGVGTGMDDELRDEVWRNRASWIGKIITYKFMAYGDYGAPRFPVYKGVRDKNDM